jgi:hypothetical protein
MLEHYSSISWLLVILMRKDKCVKMVQISNNRWNLMSPKGTIMVEDILLYSPYEASEWAKKYISSWSDWSFKVIIKKGDVK